MFIWLSMQVNLNWHYFTRIALNSIETNKPVALQFLVELKLTLGKENQILHYDWLPGGGDARLFCMLSTSCHVQQEKQCSLCHNYHSFFCLIFTWTDSGSFKVISEGAHIKIHFKGGGQILNGMTQRERTLANLASRHVLMCSQ